MLYMAIISILLSLATQTFAFFIHFRVITSTNHRQRGPRLKLNQSERDEVKLKLVEWTRPTGASWDGPFYYKHHITCQCNMSRAERRSTGGDDEVRRGGMQRWNGIGGTGGNVHATMHFAVEWMCCKHLWDLGTEVLFLRVRLVPWISLWEHAHSVVAESPAVSPRSQAAQIAHSKRTLSRGALFKWELADCQACWGKLGNSYILLLSRLCSVGGAPGTPLPRVAG